MYEDMQPEEQGQEEIGFTLDDVQQVPVPNVGDYKILKTLVSGSTQTPALEGEIDFDSTLRRTYDVVAATNNLLDAQLMESRAGANAPDEVANLLSSIQQRQMLRAEESANRQKQLNEVAQSFIENAIASSPQVSINNTPQELAQQTTMAPAVAFSAELEKVIKDSLKETEGFWNNAKGIAQEFIPTSILAGVDLDSFAKTIFPSDEINFWDLQSRTIEKLRGYYQVLSDEEKVDFVRNMQSYLEDRIGTSKWRAALMVADVVADENPDTWDEAMDVLQKVGAPLVLFNAFGIMRGVGGISKGMKIMAAERAMAKLGAKDAIVAGVGAKVAAKGAGTVIGQASGLSDIMDTAKLVSMGVSKIMPESITTAASGLQDVIRARTEQLVADLTSTVRAGNLTIEDAALQFRYLREKYDPATNKTVHTLDVVEKDGLPFGRIVYQAPEGKPFLTQEAATAALKSMDPDGKLGMRIIPDTTNNTYLVEAGVKETLLAERTGLEAELLKIMAEEAAKKPPKAPRKPRKAKTKEGEGVGTTKVEETAVEAITPPAVETAVPAALQTAKPRYKTSELAFDSLVDKAAYQVASKSKGSKSDPEVVEWLKKTTGWDDAAIKAHADKVRAALKKMPQVDGERIRVRAQYEASKPLGSGADALSTPSASFGKFINYVIDDVFDGQGISKLNANTYATNTISDIPELGQFIERMGPLLGLQNQKLIVLQWQDLNKMGDIGLEAFNDIINWGTAKAWWTARNYMGTPYNIIIMKHVPATKVPDRFADYMSTFAHEYGHMFEHVFAKEHRPVIEMAFRKWLRGKGLLSADGSIGDLSVEQLLEYRSITDAFSAAEYINNRLSGDVSKYAAHVAQMQGWLKNYQEFFSEQFSRWAFTDEIPVSTLDTMFATIVSKIKEMMYALHYYLDALGIKSPLGADANVTSLMRAHIQGIKEGTIQAASVDKLVQTPQGAFPSAAGPERVQAIKDRLAHLDEQLAAIKDAEEGVKHGWLIQQDVKNLIRYENIRGFKAEDVASMVKLSLGDWALGTSSELYANRVVGVAATSRYRNLLISYIQPTINSLNRADRKALNDALIRGDKAMTEYNDAELTGMGLSKKAKQAYFEVRSLRNVLYHMRNQEAVASYVRRGFVEIDSDVLRSLDISNEAPFFGKVVEQDVIKNRRVFDLETGKSISITDSEFEKIKASTKVVYMLDDPVQVGDNKHLYVLADRTVPTKDITTVIPYRPGEYRRVYTDEYFIRMQRSDWIDGKQETTNVTHRTATTKADAEAYVRAMREVQQLYKNGSLDLAKAAKLQPFGWEPEDVISAFQSGELDANATFIINYNRTDDDYLRDTISTRRSFSSSRGDRVLNVRGDDNVLNPIDSVAAEITNTAYMVPLTEWRETAIYRWFTTAQPILPDEVKAMRPEDAFYYMVNNKGRYIGNDQLTKFVERVQDYVVHELSTMSKEEEYYYGAMRSVTEAIEGKQPNKAVALTGAWLRQADPITFSRTIAFHSMLGGFNPVQLFVQGMNAFNAVTISPMHGIKSAAMATLYRFALMSDNPSVWQHLTKIAKPIAETLGVAIQGDEFMETVQLIRRSGLLDGINGTALHSAELGKMQLFGGWDRVSTTLKGVSAAPFNRGEEFSRLVSFDIARREWMAANPGQPWWTDTALNKMMERQDDLTQNMTQANVASWQRGILSIPLQFLQYNIKLAMNLAASFSGNPRAFTKKEALQLAVGHSLMFGTAGMGLFYGMDQLFGEAVNDMELTPEQRLYVQQGIPAGIINTAAMALTGQELRLAIGTRFNSFETYANLVDAIFVSSNDPDAPTVRDVLTGAVGATIKRALGNYGDAFDLFYHNQDIDTATIMEGLTLIGTGTFSSLNNLHKSYLASQAMNYVQSRAGKNLYAVTDLERSFLAIGIPPATAADYDQLMKDKKKRDALYQDVAKDIQRHQALALAAYNAGDKTVYQSHRAVIQAMYSGLNVHDRIKVDQLLAKSWVGSKHRELLIERLIKDAETTPVLVNETSVGVR